MSFQIWPLLVELGLDTSPAHVSLPCKTCGDSGVVENTEYGMTGRGVKSCPDCSGEPFPLPPE